LCTMVQILSTMVLISGTKVSQLEYHKFHLVTGTSVLSEAPMQDTVINALNLKPYRQRSLHQQFRMTSPPTLETLLRVSESLPSLPPLPTPPRKPATPLAATAAQQPRSCTHSHRDQLKEGVGLPSPGAFQAVPAATGTDAKAFAAKDMMIEVY
jgi:hypothetical protein